MIQDNRISEFDGLLSSHDLCEKLNINKTMLTNMRRAGLQPQKEIKNNLHKPAAFWNLEFVEAWISDNKFVINRKYKNTDKIEEMYSRLCDAEKISYNSYANLINTQASESQITKARKEWTDVIKTLRSVEKDIQNIAKRKLREKKSNLTLNDRLSMLEEIILENRDPKDRLNAIKLYSELKGDFNVGEGNTPMVLSFENKMHKQPIKDAQVTSSEIITAVGNTASNVASSIITTTTTTIKPKLVLNLQVEE